MWFRAKVQARLACTPLESIRGGGAESGKRRRKRMRKELGEGRRKEKKVI